MAANRKLTIELDPKSTIWYLAYVSAPVCACIACGKPGVIFYSDYARWGKTKNPLAGILELCECINCGAQWAT